MKSALLALIVLFASLAYSQAANIPKATPPATPASKPQPIIEAGGLDALCQSGLIDNDDKESRALSDVSVCVGYITGWAQTISGAFIMENDKLWYVEVDDSFTVMKEIDALHKFIVANPNDRDMSSPIVLLDVAVGKKMATVSPVEIKDLPQGQPWNLSTPTDKGST
jgi:hypothetical protein